MYKDAILAKYPDCKKALNAKIKHAILLNDPSVVYSLNKPYADSGLTLFGALQPFKVGKNHYVLDKSKEAIAWLKAWKKDNYTVNTVSYFRSLALETGWSFGEKNWDNRFFMSTAWDSHSFAIHVKTEEYVDYLKQIFNAFMQKDICFIGQISGNSFTKRNGLVMGIYSLLKDEYQAIYEQFDDKQSTLMKAFVELNLDEVRKTIDATWISPERFDEGELVVWVNSNNRTGLSAGRYYAKDIVSFCNSHKTHIPEKYTLKQTS